VGKELCLEDHIFFELSEKAQSFIHFLKERGIEKIVFSRGLKQEELQKFIEFLLDPQIKTTKDILFQLNLLGIEHIQIGRLQAPAETSLCLIEKKAKFIPQYFSALQLVSKAIEKIMIKEELGAVDLQFTALTLLESFSGSYLDLIYLTDQEKKIPPGTLHILNVAVLSMYVGSQLGWPKKVLIDLGVGALFHDLGLLLAKRDLRAEQSPLSSLQPELRAAFFGARPLVDYFQELGYIPLVIAFECSLPYNIQPFGKQAFLRPPHQISQVVALSDAYDQLFHQELACKKFSPDKIIASLLQEKGQKYEPHLLDKFIQIIGYWPLGCLVKLSNGWVGQVKKINPLAPDKPELQIIKPPEEARLIDLAKEEKLTIKQALHPLRESCLPNK
jgi:HD-GYP domain-containing protein (c-di-GMP phosphodiesterase class II)